MMYTQLVCLPGHTKFNYLFLEPKLTGIFWLSYIVNYGLGVGLGVGSELSSSEDNGSIDRAGQLQ